MSEPARAPVPSPVRLVARLDGPPGAPVVVLGNSLGTTGSLWDPQLPALSRHFRVLRYEHRGHGGSPAPSGPYTIADLGRDVLALLDARGIERAAYCGVSLGGMVGMWLAANAPGRVSALALCCTSAYLPPASGWAERAALVRSAGPAAVAEQVVGRWFTPAFRRAEPAVPAGFVAELGRTDPEGYAGCCEAIGGMDLRPVLGSVTAPTLVIAGSDDPSTPPWHGAGIAAGIRGSRLVVIRGAAHLSNVSNPGQVTSLLLGHIRAPG